MLKGQVFSNQLFQNEIFALFINTFLNGKNGINNGFKNSMAVSYSGSNVTIASGAVCIQGRFLEESSSTTLDAGTATSYCKLVIEIDLDKVNTTEDFQQGYYRVISNASTYPTLTQTDIVNNVSGVYQFELARFQTSANGILNFQDMRNYIDFDSIYQEIREAIQAIESGSLYVLKTVYNTEKAAMQEDIDSKQDTIASGTAIPTGRKQWRYIYTIF